MAGSPQITRIRPLFAGILLALALLLTALPASAAAKPGDHIGSRLLSPAKYSVGNQKHDGIYVAKKVPRLRDSDRDGLNDWNETNRARTNPRRADSDGDGLSDWTEIRLTRTNPRWADSDGDGYDDGTEVFSGSDPWNAGVVPSPPVSPSPGPNPGPSPAPGNPGGTPGKPSTPPSNPTPPSSSSVEAVWTPPAVAKTNVPVTLDGTASSGGGSLECTWSFENQSGSIVWQTEEGCSIDYVFEDSGTKYVRLIVEGEEGETDSNKQSFKVTAQSSPPPPPPVDTTAPSTTIGSSPSSPTTSTSASFSFSSSESGSSFQCRLDEGSFVDCTSPRSYAGLAIGDHSFEVRATDAAGNTDPTPAVRTWTVEEPTTPPPPPDTTAPDTTIISSPSSPTTSTNANFSFNSNESGSTFACKLDGAPFSVCTSPGSYVGMAVGDHSFEVRATDAAGNTDSTPATASWTVQAPDPDPEPEPEPPSSGGCSAGMTNATSASALTSAVSSGKSVCVTADIGNVNFNSMGNKSGVVVSTEGGSMGGLEINGTTGLTLRSARFRAVTIREADQTKIESSTIGGTKANRVDDQLIFAPGTGAESSSDVVIRNNEIAWTKADDSGNTGYGCRCYGDLPGLQFVGNHLHDLAADGFQGIGGANVLIDRNVIGPVGANPDSNEHSDNIQITYNDANLRITNNWIREQGFYEGNATGNSGSIYIHGGSSGALLIENNLIQKAQGRTEICGLGTGGTSRSNITIRGNTWIEQGLAFTGFPGFEWDCDSGSGNVVERNIAVDPDGGFAQSGSTAAATFASNLWGQPSLVTLDANGNCTSANCNPAGQQPIGYRKPGGVDW